MNYQEKLKVMTDFVNENIDTVEELCIQFDITIDEIINLFPDKLVKNYSKVFGSPIDEDDDEYEKEAWAGYTFYEPEE
jgi:hypothetical protein